jgi:two-component system, chemotaxis family, chemotaxis protein CheY
VGASLARLKALVVEDNPHMRALLRTILIGLGVNEVHEAPDGGHALHLLERIESDFVITDLMMAPMDGVAFVHRLRNAPDSPNPFLPVIMVSGHTERSHILAARDAGVTEFVAKPITAKNLFLRIVEIVDRPRPFVRGPDYFGPDRRRKNDAFHVGPWRRDEDRARDLVAV